MSDLVPTMRAPLAFDTECQPFDTRGAVAWMLQRRSGGRPQTIRDEQQEDLLLSIAATRHDLRRVVNGRPGVYILTAVDEDGEEVDCPRAEVELAPMDVATGSEGNAGQQNPSPGWMASVMEQMLKSLTRHLVVSSDVSRSLAASMVDQQRACTESMRAMTETIGIASGLDALERQLPAPQVDVQELASLLAKDAPNESRPEEKQAESWISQVLKSPVTPMVLNGVAKPFLDLHQARMKKALMEAEAAQSPPVQPPPTAPPASSPPVQPPAPAEPSPPEPVAPEVEEVDDADERDELAVSKPENEPKAKCTCSSTTAASPPAPEMMLVPWMGSSVPKVESVDATLPWASGQADHAPSLSDEPASNPQEQSTLDQDEQVDLGLAEVDSKRTERSALIHQEPPGRYRYRYITTPSRRRSLHRPSPSQSSCHTRACRSSSSRTARLL